MNIRLKISHENGQAQIAQIPPIHVNRWAVGKSIDEVMQIIPYLFNLCQATQILGLTLAQGQDAPQTLWQNVLDEIHSAHRFRVNHSIPKALGCEITGDYEKFHNALAQAAPRLLDIRFQREMVRGLLPERALNVQEHYSLWDFIQSRLIELEDLDLNSLKTLTHVQKDYVSIPAARGYYQIGLHMKGNFVTELSRKTPTDHMIQSGGIINCLLENLPQPKAHEIAIAMAILDPCFPVEIAEVDYA